MKNRYPRMVHENLVNRVREIMENRARKIAKISTADQALRYVEETRRKVKKCFGPFPRKTALKPIVTGIIQKKDYHIEKVVFQSRPGYYVTGNFYVPKKILKGGCPAVLGLCGHANEGKAYTGYQSFCQGLVKRGFVVFIIDPIAQGDREFKLGNPDIGLCPKHNVFGQKLAMLGEFSGNWFVWDAIRAVDYLCDRPEVDSKRLGVTGNSGGGTLTSYVTALEPRLTLFAPSCYICSIRANLENEMPTDSEQNPPGMLAAGLDHADLLICRAPNPTLILAQSNDFFDIRYTRIALDELNKIHNLLGSKNTAAIAIGEGNHGYSQTQREAMYSFFMKNRKLKGSSKEKGIEPLDREILSVTGPGTGVTFKKSQVFGLIDRKSKSFAEKRSKFSEKKLKKVVTEFLALPSKEKELPEFRVMILSGLGQKGAGVQGQFTVETEKDNQIVVTTYGPEHPFMSFPKGKVRLYLGHLSSENELEKSKLTRSILKDFKTPVLAVDQRGIGQSRSKTCGNYDFFYPYGCEFYYSAIFQMLNESYLGKRVGDVLQVMDLLMAEGVDKIELVGRGLGSLTAVYAALLHESRPKVEIFDYLPSYQGLIDAEEMKWPLSSAPYGTLKQFDLPDIYGALGKRLRKSHPWSSKMARISSQK